MLIARLAALALLMGSLPLPQAQAAGETIYAPLCNGGRIAIVGGDGDEPQPPAPSPAKACHSGMCRKQFDRSQ